MWKPRRGPPIAVRWMHAGCAAAIVMRNLRAICRFSVSAGAQSAQGLGFDLSRAFACDDEQIADLLQGMLLIHLNAKTMSHSGLLSRGKNGKVLAKRREREPLQRAFARFLGVFIFDIIFQRLLLARRDGHLQRHRMARQPDDDLDDM